MTAVVVGVALVVQAVLVMLEGQATMPARMLRLASYFTIETNLLVFSCSLLLALRPVRDGTVLRVVRLGGLVGITVTFLVYLVLLRPTMHLRGWDAVADAGLHYVSPVLMVAGWLLFGPRRRIDVRTALLAVAWPVGWFGWTLLHGAITDFYPYPFVDVRIHGYDGVLLRAVVVVLLLTAVGTAAWTFDRKLGTRT